MIGNHFIVHKRYLGFMDITLLQGVQDTVTFHPLTQHIFILLLNELMKNMKFILEVKNVISAWGEIYMRTFQFT